MNCSWLCVCASLTYLCICSLANNDLSLFINIANYNIKILIVLIKNWALQVADNVYVKSYMQKNSITYAENDDGSWVRYPSDIKSTRFWSQLQVKPHWRVVIQQNSLSVDDNIYIYIYSEREIERGCFKSNASYLYPWKIQQIYRTQ